MACGKIGDFDVSSGNWTLYVERLEMFFKANDVPVEKYLPTLIAVMGAEAYELLSNLISPKKPSEVTYKEVNESMQRHLEPKPSFMAERYKFRQRRQGEGESVSQYVTELKKLAKYCDFNSVLEDNLRDQFICGLKNELIRQRLFAETSLSYTKAVGLALSLEAAERDAAMVEPAGGNSGAGGTSAGQIGATTPLHSVTSSHVRGKKNNSGDAKMQRGFTNNNMACSRCGLEGHSYDDCRYKKYTCSKCGRVGHLRRACPARTQRGRGGGGPWGAGARGARSPRNFYHVHAEEGETQDEDTSDVEEQLNHLCLNGYKPVSLSVNIDNIVVNMEIDTGSAISCISKDTYLRYFQHRKIEPFDLTLKFYDGSRIKPLGVIRPTVKYENKENNLELFIIEGGTVPLLGRHWLTELGVKIPVFFNVINGNNNLNNLLDRYKELFNGELGRFTGGSARLRVREGAEPVFCRARPLPYALRERVDRELDDMLRSGVIEPVETSEWATPLVPVRKADGGLRICADYKVTLNPALMIDRYPLPKIDDLLVGLNGARIFSKIDLSQAYNQIELDESRQYTVINTHRGLFKYNRLVYGLSSSPGIFQRIMSNLLSNIPGVEVFLDDIIIGSKDESTHLITLQRVLQKLHSNGMKLKKNKCHFLMEEVQYLGYIISKDGVKVDPSKVEAISKIPRPQNVTELRSFLGLVNFYAKFVRNLSTVLSPLYDLLRKGVEWRWSKNCEAAFNTIKRILTSAEVLTHYDQNKPLTLTCDASARGIGGVLTQPREGAGAGGERPVAYVSRSLNDAERNYSQIDKEALAIIFCLEKLHQFLYGRKFTLRTDHKPLVSIFGPKQGIPAMVASRLQRWAIKLSAYTYDIEYVSTKDNGADGLSRLPVMSRHMEQNLPEQTYLHFAENDLLLDSNDIKTYTQKDPLLCRVLSYIRHGWPKESEIKNLQPYFNRRQELYEELGCVMWGHRVVVPQGCRERVLSTLHESHMGIVKTKAIARSYVWWPGIDEAVEGLCRQCGVCAAEADAPPRHSPCPWPWPSKPWSRVHLDFLGPLYGKMYLIMIDARTKWLEVFPVSSTSAANTLDKLNEVCARWGLPKQIVSDNGPPFTSKEFSMFLSCNGIEHLFSAPYHPASNGAAENAVRTVKRVIKKAVGQKQDVNRTLSTFLLHYRNTAHCTTGESPASLMLGRPLRTKLDSLRPDRENKVRKAQLKQLDNVVGVNRDLQPGDDIWLRHYQGNDRWLPGQVKQRLSTTDYRVLDGLGRESHRHIDQLRRRSGSLFCPSTDPEASQSPGPAVGQAHGTNESSSIMPEVQGGDLRVLEHPSNQSPPARGRAVAGDGARGALINSSTEPPTTTPASTPTRESPHERPIRTCRLMNPPRYRF